MSFSVKTLEFLDENYVRNSKEWFVQHKAEYEEYVKKPFSELLEYLAPVMEEIDPKLICTPKCVSRIYRDARFVKGGSIFREGLWCSIRRRREPYQSVPEFYFHVSPQGFGYGCGYYCAGKDAMEEMRNMILSGDKVFKAAKKMYDSQDRFTLWGEMYKRNHYPQQPEDLCEWLNRKSICLSFDGTDPNMLFSDDLPEKIAEDFKMVTPVYRLYTKMENDALAHSKKERNTK